MEKRRTVNKQINLMDQEEKVKKWRKMKKINKYQK